MVSTHDHANIMTIVSIVQELSIVTYIGVGIALVSVLLTMLIQLLAVYSLDHGNAK